MHQEEHRSKHCALRHTKNDRAQSGQLSVHPLCLLLCGWVKKGRQPAAHLAQHAGVPELMKEDSNFALVKGFGVICVDDVNTFALLQLFKQFSQKERSWVRKERPARKPCWPSGRWQCSSRWETRTFLITLSNTLVMWLVSATGLQFLAAERLPPLWRVQTSSSISSGGMDPLSREDRHSVCSSHASSALAVLSSSAGIPSGPGTESGFSSLQPFSMSCSVKVKSVILFSVLPIAKNSSWLGTDHSALAEGLAEGLGITHFSNHKEI